MQHSSVRSDKALYVIFVMIASPAVQLSAFRMLCLRSLATENRNVSDFRAVK
jgi:hypothetical protein